MSALATATSMVVPMYLDALVVNNQVKSREGGFRWWRFNYNALKEFLSPEPSPGDNLIAMKEGVYLHWSLPQALRHGQQNVLTGEIEYPLVPNRWLVVRMQGTSKRMAKAWVIESDCPLSPAVQTKFPTLDGTQMSMYLLDSKIIKAWQNSSDPLRNSFQPTPRSPDAQTTVIGVPFSLDTAWSERSKDTAFLTAVAPGNAEFSMYYPHNMGVFSMYDSLEGVAKDTLSYQVVGWYSNADNDILASWQNDTTSKDPYGALLKKLNWEVSGSPTAKATQSYYQGLALNIDWDLAGVAPPNDPLPNTQRSNLNVAMGNTTIDAFTALVDKQLKSKYSEQTIRLLQAFQYDLLPVINQVNGDALLEEEIRKIWFSPEQGGYRWSIVEKKSNGNPGTVLTPQENAWLLQLNQDQATLDKALSELYELQWQLNAAWWKAGRLPKMLFNKPNITEQQLEKFLSTANGSGITSKVLGKLKTIDTLLSKVPQPDWKNSETPEDAYQKGIANYAGSKNLDASKILKSVVMPRYWKSSNPTVFISGVNPAPASNPNESLEVRISSEIVSVFIVKNKTIDKATLGAAMPVLQNASGLPKIIAPLMNEFFLVDPASATVMATATGLSLQTLQKALGAHAANTYNNPLPSLGLDPWTQPWSPMYMEWKIEYMYVPYKTSGQKNWSFNGNDYEYTPGNTTPTTTNREVRGISLLSPHTQFVFKSKLTEFIDKYADKTTTNLNDLKDIEKDISTKDHWKFLAQELTGFNDLLIYRDTRAFRRPGPNDILPGGQKLSAAELAGYPNSKPAGGNNLPSSFQGKVNTSPYLPDGEAVDFNGVRQGQCFFRMLNLYDNFGRMLHVIEDAAGTGLYNFQNFPVIMDKALVPDKRVPTNPANIVSVIQLPPRILQNGKLDIALLDGKDQNKVLGLNADVNPIAGWVLPNHLDNSLLIYGPEGMALGEYSLFVQPNGSKLGKWQPPPHNSTIKTLKDVGTVSPILEEMLSATALGKQSNFEAFLQVVDDTLWTVDPLGNRDDQNLSVLIGRPLALVRTKLQFQLHGPPHSTPDWDQTLNPPTPEFVTYDFGIRIGDQATRHDGVIGYYVDKDYDMFNSVVQPKVNVPQNYVAQIGPVGKSDGNFIQLKFNESSSQYITLLVDPRAAIHAVTGILPIKKVEIPAPFIERALGNVEVGFKVGPLFTNIQQTPAQGGKVPLHANAISYPTPAEQNGIWSWWEGDINGGQPWKGYNIIKSTPNANLKGIPNSLREGILQLTIDLNKNLKGNN